jgi:hypothetical protein
LIALLFPFICVVFGVEVGLVFVLLGGLGGARPFAAVDGDVAFGIAVAAAVFGILPVTM